MRRKGPNPMCIHQTHQKYDEHSICEKAKSPPLVLTPKKTEMYMWKLLEGKVLNLSPHGANRSSWNSEPP